MSRVDEALARARRKAAAGSDPAAKPEETSSVPPPDAPAEGAEWVDEAPFREEAAPADAEIATPPLMEDAPVVVDYPIEQGAAAADAPVAPALIDDTPVAVQYPLEEGAAPPVPSAAAAAVDNDGVVDLRHLALADKLVVGPRSDTGSVEQFRRLAARLYLAQSERRTRMVMVTSALPGEGKTLTSTNLALTLSQSYKRQVLLVDGDLRRPDLHRLFEVPNISGLNDGLRAEVERKVPLIHISEHLTLLTAGRPDADPMSVLASERMRRVLTEAREKFEWVIVDTPPLGLLSDAHLLTSMIDVAVLVIQAARTPLSAVKRAVETLGRDRIAGVVLNRVSRDQLHPEFEQYYSYNTVDVQQV